MAKYDILRTEKDVSGKTRVWVDVGGEVQIFKFDKKPTTAALKNEVDKFLASKPTMDQEIQEIDRQISELTEKKQRLQEIKEKDALAIA